MLLVACAETPSWLTGVRHARWTPARPAPFPRARAILCVTESIEPRVAVIASEQCGSPPLIGVFLPRGGGLRLFASRRDDALNVVRMLVDEAWRRTAVQCIGREVGRHSGLATQLELLLAPATPLREAAWYRVQLSRDTTGVSPRMTPRASTARSVRRLTFREAFDWVRYLRFVAGRGLGVTQAQRAAEIGSNLRSIRRVRARLRPWLQAAPRHTEPTDVLEALRRRASLLAT